MPAGVDCNSWRSSPFAPFGTDDPMMRPFVRFPVNHHLGQVLERLLAIGAVRHGPVIVEAGLFNGDGPSDPSDLGTLDRFGDSWAARLTVLPVRGLELQASRAQVESPELPLGGGWDQRKWSVSARYAGGPVYGLLEWKRTTEVNDGSDVFSFGSVLAEGSYSWSGWRAGARLERSERPEEDLNALALNPQKPKKWRPSAGCTPSSRRSRML